MKVLTKLFFRLFVFSLVLISCTVQDDILNDDATETVATDDNPNKDTDPPIDEPND